MKQTVIQLFARSSLCAILFTGACLSPTITRTGPALPPLPDSTPVKVILGAQPEGKYTEIGTVKLTGRDMPARLEIAKAEALKLGGNAILPKYAEVVTDEKQKWAAQKIVIDGTTYHVKGDTTEPGGLTTQEFTVLRLEEKSPSKGIPPAGISQADGDRSDALPRASFSLLLNEPEKHSDRTFRGTMVPGQYFSVPEPLKTHAGEGHQLMLMTSLNKRVRILALVPKGLESDMKAKITSGELMEFTYSPVTVYATGKGHRIPVIMLKEVLAK